MTTRHDKNIRIAIVGAGPGGLTAAEVLRDKGYKNITIFEKSNRVGGQALSLKYITDDKREFIYELGSLQPLAAGVGIMRRLLHKYDIHVGKAPFAKKAIKVRLYNCTDNTVEVDFTKYKLGYALTFKTLYLLFKDTAKLSKNLYKYRKLAKPGYTSIPDKYLNELSISYEAWIDKQQFSKLSSVLKIAFGSMLTLANPEFSQNLPVIKLFKFLYQCLKFPPRYINGELKQVQEGYQELWKRMANSHNIHYKVHINKINRQNDFVEVITDKEALIFDKIILACSPHQLGEVLATESAEKAIYAKAFYSRGWRAAFLAKQLPHDAAYTFIEPSLSATYPHRLHTIIPEGKISEDIWLYTCAISYNRPDGIEEVLQDSAAFLQKHFNAEILEWLHTAYWTDYTPYFHGQEVVEGIYKKYEALQGKNNTFHVGALISGGTHSIVATYAESIVNRYF